MIYLGYARTGHEFDVAEELNGMGLDTWVAKKIEFVRRGKKRRAEPIEKPYLPNYIFAQLPADRFLEALTVKYLAHTLTPLSEADVRSLSVFRVNVEREYIEAQRVSKNRDAICQYKAGQALKVIDGHLSDSMLTFKAMVERSHDLHPKIVAEMEFMGRTVDVELDPLDVKAASS